MKQAVAASRAISLAPLSPTIGAQISGIDLTQTLSDDDFNFLRQALLDWKVIFFRNQPVSIDEHIRFAARFGELEVHPFVAHHPDYPQVLSISHGSEKPGGENIWHSDVTWRQQPSLGSVLHLRQVPEVGGDTLFADMGAAFRGLPDHIKRRVCGLTATHDFSAFKAAMKRRGVDQRELDAFDRDYPNPTHPVIRTHPETGEQSIYVNRAFTRRIVGIPESDSNELLEILFRQADHPEYQCRFRWENHSIAFWDNRACQHYAVSDYWPSERIAERVTIVGDTPFFRAGTNGEANIDTRFRGVVRRLATGETNNGLQLGNNQPSNATQAQQL